MGRKYVDLTGCTTEGGIYVKCVSPSIGGAGRHKRWICICPKCGNEFESQSNHLIGDKTKSCYSCSRKEYNDLSGKRFGMLTVEKRLFEYTNQSMYLCKCDCGNHHIASGGHLNSGSVKSCGCLKSSYEQTIKQLLDKNNIAYDTEKIFKDCRCDSPLRFDFYIPELNMLIEMQGEQHFKEVKFWGGKEGLQKRQERDKIKEDYCKRNDYNFLAIAYNEDIEERVNEEIVWPLRKQKD